MHSLLSVKVVMGLCCILYLSCNNSPSKEKMGPTSFEQVRIVIKSPYSCFNEVNLNNTGTGVSIFGFYNSNQSNTIKSKREFSINLDKDKEKISKIIKGIKARSLVNSPYMDDGYHFILMIDGEKYIDRYGQDGLLDSALKVLVPYVQEDRNGQCDFFNLFKQAL